MCQPHWRLELGETAGQLGECWDAELLGTLWDLSHQLEKVEKVGAIVPPVCKPLQLYGG